MMDRGTAPKHVEFRTIINVEISVSVVSTVKKFITMHGHMNLKTRNTQFNIKQP